jgi:acyl-CoA thioester hydrolase
MPLPFEISVEVIFRDIDALGHTNNAVYLTYTETARIKYANLLRNGEGLHDWPLILAEVTCTFKSPSYLGEILRIGAWVDRLGTKSFDMHFHVTSTRDERLVAVCRNVLVFYDYQAGASIPIPESFRAAVTAHQTGYDLPALR